MGVVLWFFLSLYFAIIVQAALPAQAAMLQELAGAAFFPMAVVSALVLVRQGHARTLSRFCAILLGGGVLWLPAAALLGGTVASIAPSPDVFRRLQPALHVGLLVLALLASTWAVRRWYPNQDTS